MKVNDSGYAVEPIADNGGYKDPPYFMSVRLIKKNYDYPQLFLKNLAGKSYK